MDSEEKINGKLHHTHDFPEKKIFECMEQKSIKNYEFLLACRFFSFLSCAIGVQDREREKEKLFL